MITFAWVVHNNATNMARLLIQGISDIGREDIDHIASREDTIGLRDPVLDLRVRDSIGEFPDSPNFLPHLASHDFWRRMLSCDFIVFTVNASANHNAYRAADLIRSHDLFHKLIYLDEDERGSLHPDFRDMFLRARVAFVWRPRLYQKFRVHPHVVNFGFSGVEPRYAKSAVPIAQRAASVFYRGRLQDRPQRIPFVEAMKERNYPGALVMPPLEPNRDHEELIQQYVTGNRHNARYYRLLCEAKVCVTLHGGNPVGYQFWEAAALGCAQVIQSPRPTKWYLGGSYPTDLTDYEQFDPPFEPGQHFLTFESPDEMIKQIDYLLDNDEARQNMARDCQKLAVEMYSTNARAEKFLRYVFRTP